MRSYWLFSGLNLLITFAALYVWIRNSHKTGFGGRRPKLMIGERVITDSKID